MDFALTKMGINVTLIVQKVKFLQPGRSSQRELRL